MSEILINAYNAKNALVSRTPKLYEIISYPKIWVMCPIFTFRLQCITFQIGGITLNFGHNIHFKMKESLVKVALVWTVAS